MHTPSEPSSANPAPVSAARRRLLRVAARSAPLIATLPSGAALANASAFQCLDPVAQADPPGAVSQPDQYIRVQATQRIYRLLNGTFQTAYEIAFRGSTVNVDPNGNLYTLPPGAVLISTSQVSVLVIYRTTGVPDAPVTKDCQVPGSGLNWTPQSPQNCVWPIARVQGGVPGNIPMPRSCWCSISPNDGEAGCLLPP